jgi:hypothetical protein
MQAFTGNGFRRRHRDMSAGRDRLIPYTLPPFTCRLYHGNNKKLSRNCTVCGAFYRNFLLKHTIFAGATLYKQEFNLTIS